MDKCLYCKTTVESGELHMWCISLMELETVNREMNEVLKETIKKVNKYRITKAIGG